MLHPSVNTEFEDKNTKMTYKTYTKTASKRMLGNSKPSVARKYSVVRATSPAFARASNYKTYRCLRMHLSLVRMNTFASYVGSL